VKKKSEEVTRLLFQQAQAGSVLILVVWIMSLLSFLAVGFGARAEFGLSLVSRVQEQLTAYYAARGGIHYAFAMLENDTSTQYDSLNEPWYDDEGTYRDKHIGNAQYSIYSEELDKVTQKMKKRYGLSDEDSKLNLNTATADILKNIFFTVGGVKVSEAREIADAILDWRDEDSDRRPYGAEDSDYRGKRDAYESKDAAFESVEELLLVDGVSMETFVRVEPYITAYGSGLVNLNTAGRAVLKALGLSEVGVTNILAYRSGADGKHGTTDDVYFISVGAILDELTVLLTLQDIKQITQLQQLDLISTRSDAYKFSIEGKTIKKESRMQIDCIIDRSGKILFWNEA